MKKFLMTFSLLLSVLFVNAQIATENSKILDNTYVGVEIGATTPLNFNSVFPINPVAGIKFGKELTPVFGFEVEGLATFGDNVYRYGYESSTPVWEEGPFNIHDNGSFNTFVKSTNVGLNGVINLSNLLLGYQGVPRFFEVKTNTGLGWLHYFGDFTTNKVGGYKPAGKRNVLTAKTALDLDFNLGNKKAHTITVSPGIYWNLSEAGSIKFNKNYAQFGVMLGYTYHFKTSNGTRYFKTYDVGAMINEINYLNGELAKKPNEVVKYVNTETVKTITEVVQKEWVVQFAKNSYQLSEEAKETLDNVTGDVNIIAYASPEGTSEYNLKMSERRAAAIADYLSKKNIKVISNRGLGCLNETSNRIGIITRN